MFNLTRTELQQYYEQMMDGIRINDGNARVRPYQVIVNVTMRCNSRCPYCDVWQKQVDGQTLEHWETVLNDLKALGIREFIISGGEPLLRPDIDQWIQKASDYSFFNVLITNGLLLTDKRIEQLIRVNTHRITLSFDSFSDETFRLHRGTSSRRPKEALFALARALKASPPPWFSVGVNVVATARNIHEIPEVVEYASDNRMSVQIQVMNQYPGLDVHHLLPGDTEMPSFRQGIERLISMKEAGYPINTSIEYLRYAPDFTQKGKLPADHHCLMADVAVILDENFNLLPCWFLPSVGNVTQVSVSELWNSSGMRSTRQKMHAGHCPGCWLTCNADWEISFLGERK